MKGHRSIHSRMSQWLGGFLSQPPFDACESQSDDQISDLEERQDCTPENQSKSATKVTHQSQYWVSMRIEFWVMNSIYRASTEYDAIDSV